MSRPFHPQDRHPRDGRVPRTGTPPRDPALRRHLEQAVAAWNRGEQAIATAHAWQAHAIDPDEVNALRLLARAAQQSGNYAEAIARLERVVATAPDAPEHHYELGHCYHMMDRLADAAAAYRRALIRTPADGGIRADLATILVYEGDTREGRRFLVQALALSPDHGVVWGNFANLTAIAGDLATAHPAFATAFSLLPSHPPIHSNHGNTLSGEGRLLAAWRAHLRAIALDPLNASFRSNLASVLREMGEAGMSVAHHRIAVALKPADHENWKRLLASLAYDHTVDNATWIDFHRQFGRMAVPRTPPPPPANPRAPERRLRIGYLSGDFRRHPVARSVIPLLRHHDRTRFEVYGYSNVRFVDDVTRGCEALADHWRPVLSLREDEIAETMRRDGIDILVVLAAHFDDNRPLVAGLEPAPVIVSHHDIGTMGMRQIDYLIADRVMAPRDTGEPFVERPIRMPGYVLMPPPENAPPPGPPPMLARGAPTFGSFNNPAKVTPVVQDLWSRVLLAIPGARLVLKYRVSYFDPDLQAHIRARFEAAGVSGERIRFIAREESFDAHMARYHDIDVALDTYPFSGSTTTFEALWMGVPVVTLAGPRMVGRWSASILAGIGVGGLVAFTPERYVELAAGLVAEPEQLAALRRELRPRMAASPMTDPVHRTRQLERVYRTVWRRWCAAASGKTP